MQQHILWRDDDLRGLLFKRMTQSVGLHDFGDSGFTNERLGIFFSVVSNTTAVPVRILLGEIHHGLFFFRRDFILTTATTMTFL